MNNFEKLHNMSIEQFSEWLDEYGQFDGSPWMSWFDKKYCNNCPSIMCHYEDTPEHEFPCCWCELNDGKCKYFPDMDKAPDNREMIKIWLEQEIND